MGRIRHCWVFCDLCSHIDMHLTAFCSHCLSILLPPCRCLLVPMTSQLGIVVSMRNRLPTLRTSTADLVSSFIFANEMLVDSVLGIDILYEASDPGAALDYQDHYGCRCFPGTREQYIADITNWVTESVAPPSSMYWMRGPAGVGKSAIAQTCAEKPSETGHLGAAFFFTVDKHSNPSRLFTTIAYQLAITLPDYFTSIDERISKDKTLVEKKIPAQFRSLILEPIQELQKQGRKVQPKAVFIDGLDGWGRASRNYQDNCILCQRRIHSILLGYLQLRPTSHCVHNQAGQHRLCHSFY